MSKQVMQLLNEVDSDLAWFKDNFEELKERYDNMFIAIRNGHVLAAEENVNKLINELKRKRISSAEVIIQFVSSIPAVF
jgi:hypothetical protein